MNPNTTLLQQYTQLPAQGDILLCNVDDERYIRDIGQTAFQVTVHHRDHAVLTRLKKRFLDHDAVHIADDIFPTESGRYDAAILCLPKGRDLARAMLVRCLDALEPQALLFAVGANTGGAKTAHADCQALTFSRVLGTKARHRIFSAQRPDDLTVPEDWGTPWEAHTITIEALGREYDIYTQAGVFSYQHLDAGTQYLLEHLDALGLPAQPRILDAGCGTGILGMAAAHELAARRVVWADVDRIAVGCVRQSLPGGDVIAADLTQDTLSGYTPFDGILCNPPFHKDHEQSSAFLRGFAARARGMLAPGGRLAVVFNNFLPYWDILESNFGDVQFIADNDRFQILVGKHPD